MGQDFSECWASAWPVIGEPFARALEGHASFIENQRMFLDRNGYLEETFFTFSFSPIRDETGGVGGVLNPCHETTSKMLSERRTRALRDLAARTVRAKSVPEVLELSAQTLMDYDLDVPFAQFFARDTDSQQARLAAGTGLMGPAPSFWPLAEVFRSGSAVQVDDIGKRLGPQPYGPYPEPPKTALLLPIMPPGAESPSIVLVAGVSPRLPLNETYRSFYDFLAAGVTTAIANATAYEEEKKRAEALAEIDRAKTAFFSNVSHEFRTPLTLLLLPLEDMLAQSGALPAQSREGLDIAHRNSLRLLKLVNTLLDFSRIEEGRIQALYEPTDLGAYTAELASVFRSAVEKAGLQLIMDCPALPDSVYVDREMWEKIVFNLLSNAFKFTFVGEISVSLRRAGGMVELAVKDTGTGIPAAEVSHLFERFHQVKGARGRSLEGSGIGLALVQELVKLHGGAVRVESEIDRGSTFTVSIPVGVAHLPADCVETSRPLASSRLRGQVYIEEALRWLPVAHSPGGADKPQDTAPVAFRDSLPTILLADDNADMREYVRGLLSEHYAVETVTDGVEALNAARERTPDLVLTDVMMPKLDGLGLLKELRADERLKTVPVILLSARAGQAASVEGIESGADDYLIKPFSAKELLARVGTHIKLTRIRKDVEKTLRENEERLRGLVAEREALLKEVHHRVKNNLQVIVSLLEMQARQVIHDRRAFALFEETRNRVMSISSMHELLYRSSSFAEIDLAVYARQLVAHLVSFHRVEERVVVSVLGHGISVPLESAVPCGLLLNELISNVCKHAFPGTRTGHVSVTLREDHEKIHVKVTDDGIGLGENLDPGKSLPWVCNWCTHSPRRWMETFTSSPMPMPGPLLKCAYPETLR
jgi:signal transduction histidine kinase